MNEISTEKIMTEIRQNIERRGYTKECLRFDEVLLPSEVKESAPVVSRSAGFSEGEFELQVNLMNSSCSVPINTNIEEGNFIKRFMKKISRKMVMWLLKPVVDYQNNFNAATVRTMNQVFRYVKEDKYVADEVKKLSEGTALEKKETMGLKSSEYNNLKFTKEQQLFIDSKEQEIEELTTRLIVLEAKIAAMENTNRRNLYNE
ncbi:MAG: hypothetical protein K6F97_06740 [Lachnospiraceae bacterium]|nr:hypothetical protein [Lachnospiraceae bacterium]